ncbi:MAG: SIMPL domain-containing protein, partial [Flammeovirgaceae bacterium]
VSITEVSHTDIEKFKTEAKVKAINNANEKAVLLTTTLDSKLGHVLQIRETELVDVYPTQALQGRVAGLQVRGYSSSGYDKVQTNTVDFEQIKLTYKIVVKFKIE